MIVYIVRLRYFDEDNLAGQGCYFFSAGEAATYMWGRDRKDYLVTVYGRELPQDSYTTVDELLRAIELLAQKVQEDSTPCAR